jgi:glycosyltransferase involved in cell wall biosynthesis
MFRRADGVLVNSGAGKEFLESNLRVPPHKITHIRNWVDPNNTSIVRELPGHGIPGTIGFVGRFAKQKRLDLLLSAFSRVLELAPQTRLILMGDGSERDALIDHTRSLGIGDNVEFVDPTPDVQATMKRFHIFVIPSAFEGLPNAAIEALAMGIPIVSTHVGDIDQLIVDGKTGLFFENETPAAMAETLVGALANRDLLESALRAGPQAIENDYSIERALDQLLPVYNQLL